VFLIYTRLVFLIEWIRAAGGEPQWGNGTD